MSLEHIYIDYAMNKQQILRFFRNLFIRIGGESKFFFSMLSYNDTLNDKLQKGATTKRQGKN
jgi:hypothetical protein